VVSTTPPAGNSTRWLWIALLWGAVGLFDASQSVMIMHKEGRHQSWLPLFTTELALWLPWALATPLITRLARRHPVTGNAPARSAAVHLGAFAVLAVLTEAWSALLQVAYNPWGNRHPPEFVDTWSTSLLYQALTFLVAYALVVTVTLMLDSRDRVARQAAEASRLNEELSRAELAALRQQMEPHFMFNTLNAIAGLVRDRQNDTAVSMIVGLSEFLRRSAQDSHRAQVTLAEEVEYLQRYLDIQKVRLGERLEIEIAIPRALLEAQVPNLLLQPLVENAIKHGISKRVVGGAVRISGVNRNGLLFLSVKNDGPCLPVDWRPGHTGVGVSNLRTRLRILYGGQAELDLQRLEAGGAEVVVRLPFTQT
jgi:two-component system, LytTR family, sensor kinase